MFNDALKKNSKIKRAPPLSKTGFLFMLLHYKELKKLIKPSFNIYIANNAMVNVFLALFIKV